MTSMLTAATKRFRVVSVLHAEDGAIVPVESARTALDFWYRAYLDRWTRSGGMAAVGHGGLLIETWGLVWFVTPNDEVLNSTLYWIYALGELLRGADSSNVAAWEESRMTASLRGSELVLEETDPTTGFVFFPPRRLEAEAFFAQLLRECQRIQGFSGELLTMCDREAAPGDFRRTVARNAWDGFSEGIGNFEQELAIWRGRSGTQDKI